MKRLRSQSCNTAGFCCAMFLCCTAGLNLQAQVKAVGGLTPVARNDLSDPRVSKLGDNAFSVRKDDWLHAESQNFIYHFFENFIATPVTIEAEYYYKIISRELQKDTTRWERKSHIFIFDRQEDWDAFKTNGDLDPWTGGLHYENELYVFRNSARKWKGHSLGHEVAHLVLYRFFGNGIPLWLNEGFAEYSSIRAYSSYYRARGYRSKPWARQVSEEHYIDLADLVESRNYSDNPEKVKSFYAQSERLVRFLTVANNEAFQRFLDDMSAGAYFQTALLRHYNTRWSSVEAFEEEFRKYVLSDRSAGDALQQAN